MKIDFEQVLLNIITGKPFSEDEKFPDKKLTLKDVCMTSILSGTHEEDIKLPGDAKYKRFALAQKINNSVGPIELSVENIVIIKQQIAKYYVPLILGPAFDMLDPSETKEK